MSWEWLDWVRGHLATGWIAALAVALGSFLVAWLVEIAVIGILRRLAARTRTDLDDTVIDMLKRPVFVSLLLFGFQRAVHLYGPGEAWVRGTRAAFFTIAVTVWCVALMRLSRTLLQELSKRPRFGSVIQSRTLPLFDMLLKTALLGIAVYLTMVAWRVDVGAWLASAGVAGIAVGLAAQDSLANYFAGVFIIADAPYKLRDVITLDDGTRGTVTDIGLRSTRIHTKDGVEINIPNSVLSTMKIENRSAGPGTEERISVEVGVAYGSDIREVVEILKRTAAEVEHVLERRPPEVYFKAFGASSLDLDVKVWIQPAHYEVVRHELHQRIYDALNEAGVEIPFPQRDLHVKELPRGLGVS